jgi:hypothetical protein
MTSRRQTLIQVVLTTRDEVIKRLYAKKKVVVNGMQTTDISPTAQAQSYNEAIQDAVDIVREIL